METKPSGAVSCPDCGVLKSSAKTLCHHKYLCHSVIPYCCACCGERKSNKAKLLYHLQRSHQLTPRRHFHCSHCLRRFTSNQQMKRHFAHFHAALNCPFDCKVCGLRFFYQQDAERHRRVTHSTEKPFQCDYCRARFKLKSQRAQHQIRVHGPPSTKHFPCPFCVSTFRCNGDLRDHLLAHVDAKLFQCKHCPAAYKNRSGLNRHVKAKHTQHPEHFNCEMCSAICKSKDALRSHRKVHLAERPFGCAQCLCRFKSNPHLSKHVLRHSAVRPVKYLCDECPASFITFTGFHNHKQRHANPVKPFKCSLCSACFDSSGHLERHKITHIDPNARNFICAVCGAGFKTPDYCAGHIQRVHNTKTSFRCPLCLASFKLRSSLTHTGERKHDCQLCARRFKTKKALRLHQGVHSNVVREKADRCRFCPAAFAGSKALKRHIAGVHSSVFNCSNCDRHFCSAGTLARHKLK